MALLNRIKTVIQGYLPEALQEYWYIVPIWAVIMLILIIVLIAKALTKKKGTVAVQNFKQQNKPSTVIPAEHQKLMEQHNVHVPHTEFNMLDNYILQMLERKVPAKMIKKYLVSVGWDPKVIDEAYIRLMKR